MTMTVITPTDTALTPFTPTERAQRIRRYVDAGKADATKRAYAIAWRAFEVFCGDHGYVPHPAPAEAVVDYLTALADAGASVSKIGQHRAAIRFYHRGQANPCADDRVEETMKGITRKVGTMSKPKAALSPDELRKLVATLPDDLRGKRDRALLLMGWAGAFRRSELVALDVADIDTRGNKLTVTLRRSKTDQEGQGLYKSIPSMEDATICPVAAYRAWLDAAKIQSGLVFRSIDRWGHTHEGQMDGREVARIVKSACKRAGIDERRFAGHSLRSGFVTAATLAGANDSDIMEQTNHKSSATLRRYKQMAGLGAQRAVFAAFGAAK